MEITIQGVAVAKKIDKETLFQDYFDTANEVLYTFEVTFGIKGVWQQFFGIESGDRFSFNSPEINKTAQEFVLRSGAWRALSDLYDYAIDGIAGNMDPTDIVIGGAEVLSFMQTENRSHSEEWQMVTAKGDGRFTLDDGDDVPIEKVALLADVDVRTVRNAISAGEMTAYKVTDGLRPGQYVENASARQWLQGRRGFKATVMDTNTIVGLEQVTTPAAFGAFLSSQRQKLALDTKDGKLAVFHPAVDGSAVSALEAGIFNLPLNAVFPIADFYQLERKAFLACVMRVFFADQLASIREFLVAG